MSRTTTVKVQGDVKPCDLYPFLSKALAGLGGTWELVNARVLPDGSQEFDFEEIVYLQAKDTT